MKKVKVCCILIIVLLATVVSGISYLGFNQTEKKAVFLNEQMWALHEKAMHDTIVDDYPLADYLKDMIVNIGLYKDFALVSLTGVVVATLALLFLHLKKKTRNTVGPLGEASDRCRQ